MPVNLTKSDQLERVWVYEMIGHWTWGESFKQFEREVHDAEFSGKRYDVIVDMRQTRDVPNSSLPNFRTMVSHRREHGGGLTVIVSANTMLLILAPVFRRLYTLIEKSIHLVKTYDEAYQLIRKDREGS